MKRTVAVVAHFDPNNVLDPTFHALLEVLDKVCCKVILVTTSELTAEQIPNSPKITTICRPNIGYDFYSYRVGITELLKNGDFDELLLLNSSFIITNSNIFQKTLESIQQSLADFPVVGLTESFQWQWHLQSYLVGFRRDFLDTPSFRNWLSSINPTNTKLETILAGEFGLSAAIENNGAPYKVSFSPSLGERRGAAWAWAKSSILQNGLSTIFKKTFWQTFHHYNPTHFLAKDLALHAGLVKTELLRNNPHGLNLNWLDELMTTSDRKRLTEFLARSQKHYARTDQMLTGLAIKQEALPSNKLIYLGPLMRPGVKIAVVVHLFYPELATEIFDLLRNVPEPFDLIITTPHEGAVANFFDTFSPIASSVVVSLSENRGRDVGPFLAVFRSGLLDKYDAVLKLHSKKSKYSEQGMYWQRSLFKQLCGNSLAVMDTLTLLRSGNVGMVGPQDYYLTHPHYWGANQSQVNELMRVSATSPRASEDVSLGFFAGTMFWFAPVAFSCLHRIPEAQLEFGPELGMQDGTLAHALERIFCNISRQAGYSVTTLNLKGVDIENLNNSANLVPVLPKPPTVERVTT